VSVSATTTFADAGTKSVTATFTPADSQVVAASTSAAATVTVSGGTTTGAQATTTTLNADPAAPTTRDVVTLKATVSPAAAGKMTFKDGDTTIAVLRVRRRGNGVVTLVLRRVAAGQHSYTASFAPSDTAAFVASASPAVAVTVTQAPVTGHGGGWWGWCHRQVTNWQIGGWWR